MTVVNEEVTLYKKDMISYKDMGIDIGRATLASVVEAPFSSTMGAGLIRLEQGGTFEWQVLYDEILFVVSGELIIIEQNEQKIGHAGDIFFLKKDTTITYSTSSETEFFYSIYPANWREIHGLV